MPAPALRLARIVLDVSDVDRSSDFWCAALGYEEVHRDEAFCVLRDPKRPEALPIGLQPAEGAKVTISPIHLEVFTDDMNRERARLEKLGASRVRNWTYPVEKPNWIVMRDPDGHEFCIVEPDPRP